MRLEISVAWRAQAAWRDLSESQRFGTLDPKRSPCATGEVPDDAIAIKRSILKSGSDVRERKLR
jgi:hypothetical protein